MKMTLLAAISADGYIADKNGNGDFSSAGDKAHLKAYLRSEACDCFIAGRKTAEEFKDRLTYKPMFVLSRTKQGTDGNLIYVRGLKEIEQKAADMGVSKAALLGGAETYHYFLKKKAVTEIKLTCETIVLYGGIRLDLHPYLDQFTASTMKDLPGDATVFGYQRKPDFPLEARGKSR